jgi:hypothetical protein
MAAQDEPLTTSAVEGDESLEAEVLPPGSES